MEAPPAVYIGQIGQATRKPPPFRRPCKLIGIPLYTAYTSQTIPSRGRQGEHWNRAVFGQVVNITVCPD
jgi:hypothetical protein